MAIAILLMAMAMSLIPLGDAAGKVLMTEFGVAPVFVAWTRFVIGALALAPFAVGGGLWRALCDWRILMRGALIAAAICCILTALRTEPLANVFAAFFVGPILSYFLSAFLLKEPIGKMQTVLLFLGFLGVLLVVRPGFGMGPGMALAVLAGVFYAGYLTASRWLRGAATPRHLMFAQLVAGLAILAPFGIWSTPALSLPVAGWIALSGMASLCGNLLLLVAYGRMSATVLAPFVYFQLPAATAFGFLFFGDVPDALVWAGLVLLVGSGFGSLATRARP